jgi:hypothetical protein
VDETFPFWLRQGHGGLGSSGGALLRDRTRIVTATAVSRRAAVDACLAVRQRGHRRHPLLHGGLWLVVGAGAVWLLLVVIVSLV